jgi:S1-C subfamily serine protease
MSDASSAVRRRCLGCGREAPADAIYCGHCGAALVGAVTGPRATHRRWVRVVLVAALAAGLAALAFSAVTYLRLDDRIDAQAERIAALDRDAARLENESAGLRAADALVLERLAEQEELAAAGLAPLARRLLRSVFTLRTADGGGSAWAAWTARGGTYLISAAHVVGGHARVAVSRSGERWTGRVVRRDGTNDLALVRVTGAIAPPLWQDSSVQPQPRVGDTLVLVGSPFGLEGTVTTGILSRVTYNEIQTDAAANPGNSGGPAVDRAGRVVGVLLAGGGENLNFSVPIRRACVRIRRCEP